MTGTSALLFFHIDEEEHADVAKSRLFKLLDLTPKVPGVSLMILTTSNDFVLEEAPEGVYSYDIIWVSHFKSVRDWLNSILSMEWSPFCPFFAFFNRDIKI